MGSSVLFRQIGVPVLKIGVPNNFDELRARTRAVAAGLGTQEQAWVIVAGMDARVKRLNRRR